MLLKDSFRRMCHHYARTLQCSRVIVMNCILHDYLDYSGFDWYRSVLVSRPLQIPA